VDRSLTPKERNQMKYFTILFTVFLFGCANDEIKTYRIAHDPAFEWLENPMFGAIDFWAQHNVDLVVSDVNDAQIFIEAYRLSDDYHGLCDGCRFGAGVAQVNVNLEEKSSDFIGCVIAHEIGHWFGMNHNIDSDGLMSIPLAYEDQDCLWSQEDQDEYDSLSPINFGIYSVP
jgi:hypothetical protein